LLQEEVRVSLENLIERARDPRWSFENGGRAKKRVKVEERVLTSRWEVRAEEEVKEG
jgi:hypothetical protein